MANNEIAGFWPALLMKKVKEVLNDIHGQYKESSNKWKDKG
jgi:hypothetical protein